MGLARACSKLRCTSVQVLESRKCECEFLHTQCDVAAGICYFVQRLALRCKVFVPVLTVPLLALCALAWCLLCGEQ